MYCTKCGKEIPDGEEKVCEECKKSIIDSIVNEENNAPTEENTKESLKKENLEEKTKEEKSEWKISDKKEKTGLSKKVTIYLVALVIVILLLVALIASSLTKTAGSIVDKFLNMSFVSGETGNSIGNIRNYGYAAENDGWIYYLSPNEDSTEIGIFKIRNNGENKKQLFMSEMDIVSINVYDGYVYFIASALESTLDNDELDNKIYRMKTDGTELEILNDNELNNECYEIYVLNNSIYYIGVNAEICKMDLNGANKTVVADYGTGYLGITNEYIIYNSPVNIEKEEYVTYIMNIDGTDAKPIIEGKRIYSVNIEGDYIYYSDEAKKLYRTQIGSNTEELLYGNIETYNLNTNDGYAYYLNYIDAEGGNYTVGLFRVNLDGSTQTPEKLKELDSYSAFIDIVGDWVIYMDSNDEAGFINLVHKEGKKEDIELYRLDYASFYENMDFSDIQVDSGNGEKEATNEVTNTTVENMTNTVTNSTTNATTNTVENKVVENTVTNNTITENKVEENKTVENTVQTNTIPENKVN